MSASTSAQTSDLSTAAFLHLGGATAPQHLVTWCTPTAGCCSAAPQFLHFDPPCTQLLVAHSQKSAALSTAGTRNTHQSCTSIMPRALMLTAYFSLSISWNSLPCPPTVTSCAISHGKIYSAFCTIVVRRPTYVLLDVQYDVQDSSACLQVGCRLTGGVLPLSPSLTCAACLWLLHREQEASSDAVTS